MRVDGGLEGWSRIGAIATASMPPEPRVLRFAASHTLAFPSWSVQSIFWNSIHLASSDGSWQLLVAYEVLEVSVTHRADLVDARFLDLGRHGERSGEARDGLRIATPSRESAERIG